MTSHTLIWFRQDLRLADNPAFSEACRLGKVLPVYIEDTSTADARAMGGASRWWLDKSLRSLKERLDGHLVVASGDPQLIIRELVAKYRVTHVMWNRCYEPWSVSRDSELKGSLKNEGLDVRSFNGSLLWEPWMVATQSGTPYKVFTPFYRKGCLKASPPREVIPTPQHIEYIAADEASIGVDGLALMPDIPWYNIIDQTWSPGEQGAADRLERFLSSHVSSYKAARDVPSLEATSYLSPHLHFGEISPHQVWYAAIQSAGGEVDDPNYGHFLSELAWREFSYYLLYHFPTIPSKNFNPKFDHYPWREQSHELANLKPWQQGQTGVPIIDAGMRQLWQTGYMHNRVRMIVGSYLVKNLGIHWRHGEAWFWDCLVDADLASNCASWQWVAGSGADAAPFFRIFNPVLQGERFDKEGEYVRQYCPELKKLPSKYIHTPWLAPASVLVEAGVTLGGNYPQPLVDLKVTRVEALAGYEQVKDFG